MAAAGDTITLDCVLVDSSGNGLRYADEAAYEAAGGTVYYTNGGTESALSYTLDPTPEADAWEASTPYSLGDRVIPLASPGAYFYVCTTAGTSDSSEPTWGTTIAGTTSDGTAEWTCYRIRGLHQVAFTAQAGDSFVTLRMPATEICEPSGWRSDVQSYDLDSIGAAIAGGIETPGVLAAEDQDLGTITVGDSYRSPILTIPSATADQIHGVTDFTGYTITAAMRFAPGDPATDIDITASWVSAASRTLRISWDTMPAGIATKLSTATSVDCYIDVQVSGGSPSKKFTYLKYRLTVVWDRNDT